MLSYSNYYDRYLKYKNKYLDFKSNLLLNNQNKYLKGGGKDTDKKSWSPVDIIEEILNEPFVDKISQTNITPNSIIEIAVGKITSDRINYREFLYKFCKLILVYGLIKNNQKIFNMFSHDGLVHAIITYIAQIYKSNKEHMDSTLDTTITSDLSLIKLTDEQKSKIRNIKVDYSSDLSNDIIKRLNKLPTSNAIEPITEYFQKLITLLRDNNSLPPVPEYTGSRETSTGSSASSSGTDITKLNCDCKCTHI